MTRQAEVIGYVVARCPKCECEIEVPVRKQDVQDVSDPAGCYPPHPRRNPEGLARLVQEINQSFPA